MMAMDLAGRTFPVDCAQLPKMIGMVSQDFTRACFTEASSCDDLDLEFWRCTGMVFDDLA